MNTRREQVNECQSDLMCGVNVPAQADPAQMSDLEKKHVPVITAPATVKKGECFEVTVEVGKHMKHPSEPGHFISFVELYADHTYLGRQHFVHTSICPVAKFCVQLQHIHKELRAFEWCNLHGTWEGVAELAVTE
ncbi:MAG: desulfoferrodoxin family protein [Verrucomicrobiota bacterium]